MAGSTYRRASTALRRALAVVAAVALAVAFMPMAGVASADEDEANGLAPLPEEQDLGAACEFVEDPPEFGDIAGLDERTQEAIECLAFYGVTVGTSVDPPLFSPGGDVRRVDMAVFLSRVVEYAVVTTDLDLPEIEDQGFTDLDGYGADQVDAVNLLGTLEITTGTTDETFSPTASVSRRDMASFLNRLQGVLVAADIGANDYTTDDRFFADVDADLDRAGDINALAAAGIAQGTDAVPNFRPFRSVLRSQMAFFLMRHIDENVAAGVLPPLGDPDEAMVTLTAPTEGDLAPVEQGAEDVEVTFETNVEGEYRVSVSPGTDADVGPDGFEEIGSGETTVTETTATVDVPADALGGAHDLKVEVTDSDDTERTAEDVAADAISVVLPPNETFEVTADEEQVPLGSDVTFTAEVGDDVDEVTVWLLNSEDVFDDGEGFISFIADDDGDFDARLAGLGTEITEVDGEAIDPTQVWIVEDIADGEFEFVVSAEDKDLFTALVAATEEGAVPALDNNDGPVEPFGVSEMIGVQDVEGVVLYDLDEFDDIFGVPETTTLPVGGEVTVEAALFDDDPGEDDAGVTLTDGELTWVVANLEEGGEVYAPGSDPAAVDDDDIVDSGTVEIEGGVAEFSFDGGEEGDNWIILAEWEGAEDSPYDGLTARAFPLDDHGELIFSDG